MINVLAMGRSDYPTSSKLCLTARAFGASEITFIGRRDQRLERYINSVNRKWGGKFKLSFAKSYKDVMDQSQKSIKIYLTRYGKPLQDHSSTLRTYKSIVLIITPKEKTENVFRDADFNISVSIQPHTGTSAMAIFLHEYYKGRELAMHFENAQYKIQD
jgi:tRNA (cytidine56-2'-O)-methyltransferase